VILTLDVSTNSLLALLANNAVRIPTVLLGLNSWDHVLLFLAILPRTFAQRKLSLAKHATILLHHVQNVFQQTNARLHHCLKIWILVLVKLLTLLAMMELYALLTLAMELLEHAATFSILLILFALFLAKQMLNAENGQLTINSMTIANLLSVTQLLVLALLPMTLRPIARNAEHLVNQIPIAIPHNVFGLETSINVSTQQRIVTMANLALTILATLKPDNVLILTIALLLNVTLMLIALLGHKQINSLLDACKQYVTKDKDLANLFQILLALILANNLLTAHHLNSDPFATLTLDNVLPTCANMMAIA